MNSFVKKILLQSPSYIGHPIFMGIYSVGYYLLIGQHYFSPQQMLMISAPVIIITFLLPLMIYFFLRSFNKVDSIMISNVAQRRLPLLSFGILLVLLLFKISKIDYYFVFYCYFFAVLVSVILALFASYLQFKVSLHAMGVSAILLFMFGVNIYFSESNFLIPVITLILAGLVGASRLYMKAHTNTELILGYLIGIVPQLFVYQFWL